MKIGGNDPCHCGSGKKYKNCCFNNDVQTLSATSNHPLVLLNTLVWNNPTYRIIAQHLWKGLQDKYTLEMTAAAISLWYSYTYVLHPQPQKIGVYPATIEYWFAGQFSGKITMKELAIKYDVSPSTISTRFWDLNNFIYHYNDQIHPTFNFFISTQLSNNSYMNISAPYVTEHASAKRTQADLVSPSHSLADHLLFAEEAQSLKQALKHYEAAVQAGERDLGQAYFENNKGYFWGLTETRPYMRAKQGLAESFMHLKKYDKAITHFEDLLYLNPNDNQGVRYSLMSAYLFTKQYEQAELLAQQYEEGTAHFAYNYILIEYGLRGISPQLQQLLKRAQQVNPHIIKYMFHPDQLPEEVPDYYSLGDENEAIIYLFENFELWFQELKLIQWLVKNI